MLKESHIARYFDGLLSSKDLKKYISTIHRINRLEVNDNVVFDLGDERAIKIEELVKICDDFINDQIGVDDLMAISFFLQGSDHFMWDNSEEEGALIAEVLDDWASPETAFPINKKSVGAVRKCLIEGVYDVPFLEFVARRKR